MFLGPRDRPDAAAFRQRASISAARIDTHVRQYLIGCLGFVVIAMWQVSAPPMSAAAAPAKTYDSVFSYCRAMKGRVGGVFGNSPDDNGYPGHLGPSVPGPVAVAAVRLRMSSVVWRCMGGKVYACDPGADGSACLHARISVVPPPAFRQFCQQNVGSDYVPIYLEAGWASSWTCQGATPTIIRLISTDRQGFLAEYWHEVTPVPRKHPH